MRGGGTSDEKGGGKSFTCLGGGGGSQKVFRRAISPFCSPTPRGVGRGGGGRRGRTTFPIDYKVVGQRSVQPF